jgi:restriction system protein
VPLLNMNQATSDSFIPDAPGVFHYSPERLQLLKDTIPLICASKRETILFFLGAGVPESWLADMKKQVETCRANITKSGIAHDVLEKLNQKKENHLRELHEVVRRVAEFEDFSVCYPTVRLKAMGLIAEVRQAANVKDAFTGTCIDTGMEAKKEKLEFGSEIQEAPPEQKSIQSVTKDLLAVFGEPDAIRRAKILEGVLNRVFEAYGMLVRDSFAVKGACSDGVIELIDGVVEIDSDPYLVEMKWLNTPIGPNEISPHLVRVYGRGTQSRGIFISYSEYTEAAIDTCRQALAGGALAALCRLSEIVAVVERHEQGADLREMLRTKVHAALLYKKPWREYESAIH